MGLTPDEIHTARMMRREGRTIEAIAQHLGHGRTLIGDACRGYARLIQQQAKVVIVPDHVKAERDRRLTLRPRDLTAAIAGDPLPGMSALEQGRVIPGRRAAANPGPIRPGRGYGFQVRAFQARPGMTD